MSQHQASPLADLDEFARRLPKVELHCHLIGAIPVAAYLDIASRNRAPVRSADPSEAYAFTSFEDFLDLYHHICLSLQGQDDFSQAGYEALGRQAKTGNVRYTEMFFSPSDHPQVPYRIQVDGLIDGLRAAERDHGIVGRLIPSINRTQAASVARAMVEDVIANPRDEVLGIGMDNDETLGPPARFVDAYQLAEANGLKRTAHAGERGSAKEVAQTIDLLHVDRLDHGYGIVNDPELLSRVRDSGLHFTGCWSVSLIQMGNDNPALGRMLHAGLNVSINSDDPAVIPTDLAMEYAGAARTLGLDRSELVRRALAAVDATWMDDSDRLVLRRSLETEIAALERGPGDPGAESP
jgi:adenosine deaminase